MTAKDWQKIRDRIFIIPSKEDRFIVYAPLGGFAAIVNKRMGQMIKSYIESNGNNELPSEVYRDLGKLRWIEDSAKMDPGSWTYKRFLPTMVTLFPTNRCNLNCLYCYANSGKGTHVLKMSMPIARAAIRFVVRNAKKTKESSVRLGFHGGGEPLLEREFAQECVAYAQGLCRSNKLDLRLVAATNGCLSESTMAWIGDTFDSISLSCDGPDFIQNEQRPFPDGRGSWDILSRNVKNLQNKKVQFGIRVTLTDRSVARTEDIVRFFVEEWNVYDIHLEPLYQKGRGKDGSLKPPTDAEFIDAFKSAFHLAEKLDARLQYSGTRLGEIHSSFCEVDGQSFSVTPDGYATACFEVTDKSQENSDLFLYGFYDANKDRFRFDKKKLENLRQLNLETKTHCKTCFCRWNCAGDCPAKCPHLTQKGIESHFKDPGARCDINRAITQFLIEERLKPRDGKEIDRTALYHQN